MFKTHLFRHKENIITLSLVISFILLLLVNVVMLAPDFFAVYSRKTTPKNVLPVDTETVNKAVELLE